jgi:NTE family protein
MTDRERKPRTALVLAGGGTRGAYEAGIVHYVRTMLPSDLRRKLRFHIQCGSSVGAINSAFMAATAHDPAFQGSEILRLWRTIRNEDIYQRGAVSLGKFLARSVFGVLLHMIGVRGIHRPDDRTLLFQGLFDTRPFLDFLLMTCRWQNISKNMEAGYLDALTVSATNMFTGDIELFLQKNADLPHSDRLLTHLVKIAPRHVMASAALPLFFPPVPIHGAYYNDGSMRMNTPLAPAVSLGANRILIVGTRHVRKQPGEDGDTLARIARGDRPALGDVLGKVFNAIILDRVEADREQLDRINRILAAAAKHTDEATFRRICDESAVQPIETIAIFPSVDVHTLVDETVRGNYRRIKTFGSFERFLFRVLEAEPERGRDLLSYMLFEPTYLQKMIDLGFEDARRHHDRLCAFAEASIEGRPVG